MINLINFNILYFIKINNALKLFNDYQLLLTNSYKEMYSVNEKNSIICRVRCEK